MKKIALLGVTALAIVSLTACSSGNSSATKSSGKATTSTSSSKKETAKATAKWDDATKTFTSKVGVLKIDGVEKTTDYDSKPSIKVNFTLTNKQDKAENVQALVMSMMKVQQKTANTTNDLEYAILMNDSENHLQDNLNPNGTISGSYSYVLDTETDPIQIHFMENMFSEPVATYEVSL
ncbi:DUF5067 domain-containing protein [Lactococcus lactis]|uniref:DUF5067 domain-containing protein n=1 Tax=Lactococcus lactis TaxID=1358 RepID=UPI001F105BD5|nr:DUF5067 domain-containing protein [Lactococcus lactis]MCM6842252.1 DUF5067 domain-containing protein [Lactococcus lactis]MCM6848706.1 DUF5067 domain-containing protein [Lactococcus lactis]MCM6850834.1 DUF5067 domain-containing protein [Lactococcus lactis]MCM6858569.1 DUF5067 domain-containing protein [Lactococcus lactis]UMU18119.1 DUF5067 domain-containing protein [Lactococcus lactis subsp. lactis]